MNKCELEITYELLDNEHGESVSVTNMMTGKTDVLKDSSLCLYSGDNSADGTLSPNSRHPYILGKSRVRKEPVNVMFS